MPDVQKYISENIHQDLSKFLLKKSPFPNISPQELAMQIKGRNIANKKFPTLNIPQIIFPPQLNLEQTSSEITARYKADWVEGEFFLDLTAGFGIDAFFLHRKFQKTTLVEKNEELLLLVKHNWKCLGASAEFVHADLHDFLSHNQRKYDVVYLDPARRDADKKKVFLLEDLSPNIVELQKKLLAIGNKIIIKLSPLIDIHYLLSEIENIHEVHLISVKNEMKEVILVMENKSIEQDSVKIVCANLDSSEPIFTMRYKNIRKPKFNFGGVEKWLYIPNAPIQKAAAVSFLGETLGLKKLHPNTQLLTGEKYIENFPGRVLQVKEISPKILKKGQKANIIARNFPMSPEQIKAKYKLKDGGDKYLIFTQSVEGKIVLQSI